MPLLPVGSSGCSLPRACWPPPHHTHCHLPLTSRDVEPVSLSFPVIVAEVTQPSLGAGALSKRILCLFPGSGLGQHARRWVATPPSPAEDPALSSLSWGAEQCYPQQGLGERTEEGVWAAPPPASAPPVLSAVIWGAAEATGSRCGTTRWATWRSCWIHTLPRILRAGGFLP